MIYRVKILGHWLSGKRDGVTFTELVNSEIKMLTGALETIKKYMPKITITTYHKPEHAREISSFLPEIDDNYEIILRGIEAGAGAPVMLHAWTRD